MDGVPILDQLLKLQKQNIISFHMPGHKNGNIYKQFHYKNFKEFLPDIDTTEIPGTDNLHKPRDVIKAAQERAKEVFQSEETFFLVNGSTSGIYSMIMASTSPGDKIIVGRNCHQSVMNSIYLGELIPVYLYPEIAIDQGIALGISPEEVEKKLLEHPDAKAVVITYPTYHGIASDLKKIAEIVHKYDKILLIDEAHGAHLGLSDKLPMTALQCGADAVVQSTHKTLPSFTQSSMLHLQGDRIDREKLKFMLRVHQSSSPSYLLLASLDLAVMIYHTQGKYLMEKLLELINNFKEKAQEIKGLTIMGREMEGKGSVKAIDPTKLWISLHKNHITGYGLDQRLRDQFHIQVELSNIYGILGITSIANERKDFERLLHALEVIASEKGNKKIEELPLFSYRVPKCALTLREAIYKDKKRIPIEKSVGCVSGEYVIPYPPGIPILVPGEVIDEEMVQYIKAMTRQGMEILGLQDDMAATIEIIK